ncbi:two-component sensor histidine kinase [Caenispirillum salinarum AK4]|uniref:histidine kinase n=1 Tax=Caenispirillum salinarum AK4 TaxID=1238182 RepID=K9H8I3_9PROT|nr:ATP-binding protein [Caenispirillum salinarum]EKV26923.1 two-component sensor histidine kinase [Caenispirillum salinarum AK4]
MRVRPNVFQAMMEDLPQAVMVTTADGMVLWCNAAARTLCDKPPPDAVQSDQANAPAPRTAFETIAADAHDALRDMIARALGTPETDSAHCRCTSAATGPTGRPRWLDWSAAPVDWEGVRAARLIGVDVTADVEANRDERLLREALDSIPDALVLFDTDDTVLFYNQAYRDFFWYMPPLEDMRGRPFEDVVRRSMAPPRVVADPLALSDPDAYIAKRRRRLHTPSPEPFELFTAEGRWHLVRERRTPEGRFIGIRSDITDRKRVEERLSELVKELAESNRELEQFAYVASHDLQEPLRMVTSYLQLLQRRYAGKLDDTADEFIRHAVDGGARMQRLIQDLLDYSRIGRGKRPPVPVPMAGVLHQVLRNLSVATADNGATVTVPDPESLPVVLADQGELVRLFQNIIGNALKYRHPERPPVVTVSVAPDADGWCISVTDNGIGIEEAHYDRIFMIFQRLHGRESYAGTGIGLAIAKKIVDRHGGRIWVESQAGEGSSFHIVLPAAAAGEDDMPVIMARR